MPSLDRVVLRLGLAIAIASPIAASAQKAKADSALADSSRALVASVLKSQLFSMPTAPAFELLGSKPSEVTHLARPTDFSGHVDTWHDGNRLVAGVAFDTRPFVYSGGEISQYQKNPINRILFNTILSAGAAKALTDTQDVITAVGVRIPLYDKGDPRADSVYQRSLRDAYYAVKKKCGQPDFDETPASAAARVHCDSLVTAKLDSMRAAFAKKTWNAPRVELGVAGSARAKSAVARKDSVSTQAGGVWFAVAVPLCGSSGNTQLAGSVKNIWSRADTTKGETGRGSVGGRLSTRLGSIALSAEVARIWSRHKDAHDANQDWTHLGIVAEWHVPELKGWLGVSYGGDRDLAKPAGNQFALHYAIYKDRILK